MTKAAIKAAVAAGEDPAAVSEQATSIAVYAAVEAGQDVEDVVEAASDGAMSGAVEAAAAAGQDVETVAAAAASGSSSGAVTAAAASGVDVEIVAEAAASGSSSGAIAAATASGENVDAVVEAVANGSSSGATAAAAATGQNVEGVAQASTQGTRKGVQQVVEADTGDDADAGEEADTGDDAEAGEEADTEEAPEVIEAPEAIEAPEVPEVGDLPSSRYDQSQNNPHTDVLCRTIFFDMKIKNTEKDMLNKRRLIIFMLASCFLVTGGLVSPDVHAERMTLLPSLDMDYKHESNYFKAEFDEKSVDTFILRPGIKLGYVTAKSSFSLNYSLDVNQYSGETNIDDYDYTGHLANLLAKSQVTDRLAMGVENFYIKTRDPASSDDYNVSVSRDKYSMNRFAPNVFYKFGDKFGIGAKYTNLITDYSEGISEDSTEDRGTFLFNYSLNKSTLLELNYQVWTRDYDAATSDYTSNQMMLNLKKTYKNFALTAGAGYQDRDFDLASREDFDGLTWKLGFKGQTGSSDESAPKSWLDIALSQNFNDAGAGEYYYTATKLTVMAGHTFMKRIDLTLKGLYQNSDYEDSTREDDKWSLACRANYRINDIFSFAVEPGYESRDSNVATKSYDNTYVLFNIKAQYDFAGRM